MQLASFNPNASDADLTAALKITLCHLTKVFYSKSGEIFALQNINLDITEGQFCCIVGPSGCGKTTLLRILAGLDEHFSGECRIRLGSRASGLPTRWYFRSSRFFRG